MDESLRVHEDRRRRVPVANRRAIYAHRAMPIGLVMVIARDHDVVIVVHIAHVRAFLAALVVNQPRGVIPRKRATKGIADEVGASSL